MIKRVLTAYARKPPPRPSPQGGGSNPSLHRLVFLIQVSRPIVWPVLPLVYYLGLHAANARLSVAAIVQMASLTFPMNLIGCGLNDLYDYESDRRSRRRRAIWGAVVGDADRPLVWRAALAMMPLVLLGALQLATRTTCGHGVSCARRLAVFGAAGAAEGAAAARFAGQWPRVFSVAVRDGLQPRRRPAHDAAAILPARALRVRRPRAGDGGRLRGRQGGRPSHIGGALRPPRCGRVRLCHIYGHLAGRRFPQHGRSRVRRGVHDGTRWLRCYTLTKR